jgi:hypothetical protein
MHVISFGVVMLILGASASVFIGVLLVSILHLFGYRSTYHFGVWTLMDALVVDLFVISGTVTLVVWPLISSSFIFCLKHASSFMRIDPYKLPFTYGANELAITLQHAPIFAKNVSISLKSLQIMTAKSSFITFAVFSFIVMPTCSFVTVFREQRLGSMETAPLTCGAMFPEHATFWADMDATAGAGNNKMNFFESLCWKFTDLIWFITAWSAVLGALLAFGSTLTVAIQFGSSKDLN